MSYRKSQRGSRINEEISIKEMIRWSAKYRALSYAAR